MPTAEITRRELLRKGLAGTALGVAGLALPGLAQARAAHGISGSKAAIGEIYQLQAAFHKAKTTQDIDLMTSLWAPDATLNNLGDPKSPYTGSDQIRSFFLGSGSFTHRRFSFVPSFKIQIDVGHNGDHAWLYFECHDVGDYDLPSRSIAADLSLYGLVRKLDGRWVFSNMTAGKSYPLSADHFYS